MSHRTGGEASLHRQLVVGSAEPRPDGVTGDRRRDRRASESRRHRNKILLGLLFLVVGTSTAMVGTSSTFTDTETRTQSVGTGTANIELSDPNAASQFSVNISGMAPGDYADRLVNLTNSGTLALASVGVAVTTPVTTSLLDSDDVNGLQLKIDLCSVAWVQASSSVAATCSGTTTTITSTTAIATLKTSGPSYTATLASLAPAGTDRLRFHYSLPAVSTGTGGLTSSMVFTFTGTQAPGGAYR